MLDPVPSTLLKYILDLALPSITAIKNSSLQSGIVPDSFKEAVVRPLLKNLDWTAAIKKIIDQYLTSLFFQKYLKGLF